MHNGIVGVDLLPTGLIVISDCISSQGKLARYQ